MRRRLVWYQVAGPFLVLGQISFAQALTVTAPGEGVTVAAGSSIPVSVRVDDVSNVRQIRYYWFRVGDEVVGSHQAEAARFQTTNPKQPLEGTIMVPQKALGAMRLLAVADLVRGRLAGHQDFDEVIVQVQPQAVLAAIEFAVEKPWRLDMLGQRLPIPVLGQFADGIVRPLQGVQTGSRFHSSDERVVLVSQEGEILTVGNGKAVITVTNREQEGRLDVVVEGDQAPNGSPKAAAIAPGTVKPGSVVVLDGIGSRDPDGDPLLFHWKQTRGNKVDLTTPNEARTSFVAPLVSERRLLQFQLRVTDLSGPDTVKGADSEPAVMDIWVEP
jgi:hypothetical protein